MQEGSHWDLKVHINGQHTFFLHQRALRAFSCKLRKLVRTKQEKRRKRSHTHQCTTLKLADFPGGPLGFELVARFCYNDGNIAINPSNVAYLHSSATFLEMTEGHHSNSSLLSQTEAYLEEKLFYLDWKDLISSLRSCESFLDQATSSGLLERLISPLLPKISSNSGTPLEPTRPIASSSSSSSSSSTSSPDDALALVSSSSSSSLSSSSMKTPDTARHWLTKEWWFDDLTTLHPLVVECIIKRSNAFGDDNKDLVFTRFLLHYLKSRRGDVGLHGGGLADTAVHGVASAATGGGATLLPCRFLLRVRSVVGGLGLSDGCRSKLESLTGAVLDQASLDDLLVCGEGAVYDVGLVVRLVGVFMGLAALEGGAGMRRVRKVGGLVDNYLREVSPDARLEPAEFAELAGILPDSARSCFDGVYRALEIYLESHPKLTFEERSRLCRCLNYEKLTLEACRDLAKNPWIPPEEAVQALMSQKSKLAAATNSPVAPVPSRASRATRKSSEHEESNGASTSPSPSNGLSHGLNMQKMNCMLMRGQLPKMVRNAMLVSSPPRYSDKETPKLC